MTPNESNELAATRHALWNLAGSIVAIVDSGDGNMRELACTETSPLVDGARDAIQRFNLSNKSASPVGETPTTAPFALVAMVKEAQDASLAYNQIVLGDTARARAAKRRNDAINAVLGYDLPAGDVPPLPTAPTPDLVALVQKLQAEVGDYRVEEVPTCGRNGLQRCKLCFADADNCAGSTVQHEPWCAALFAWTPAAPVAAPPQDAPETKGETCAVCDGPVVDTPSNQACVAGRYDRVVCGQCVDEIAVLLDLAAGRFALPAAPSRPETGTRAEPPATARVREWLGSAPPETPQAETVSVSRVERHFRRWLWSNHGCDPNARYGDDGEMQCNALGCRLDFLRDDIFEIERKLHERQILKLSAALARETAPTEGK